MEGPAEDPVGGGAEGDWEVEGTVEDSGSPGGREMWASGSGLPLHHGCREGVCRALDEEGAVSEVSEAELREFLGELGAGAEEPGAGGTPLFLPAPDFMESAGMF